MKVTHRYITQLFDRFNQEIFNGELPPIAIFIGAGARTLGCFVYPRRYPANAERGIGECRIRMSGRFDREEREIEDTLIHEMIHYKIWLLRRDDEAPHGPTFIRLMTDINMRHGRSVNIRGRIDEETRLTDVRKRNNYICVTKWKNGKTLITVCARTCIFKIHRAWSEYKEIEKVEWYWSSDIWFNRYPLSRTPKAYAISDENLVKYVFNQAVECIVDGRIFRPKK